jgi:hypothetical protein
MNQEKQSQFQYLGLVTFGYVIRTETWLEGTGRVVVLPWAEECKGRKMGVEMSNLNWGAGGDYLRLNFLSQIEIQ